MDSQHLDAFHHQNRRVEIFTGQNCNFTGSGVFGFDMLWLRVKPEYTRMHLKPDNLQEKQLNNETNLLDVSRTLLRIVAQLPKNEYSVPKSNGHNERQAEVVVHNDLPNPASAEDTTQG